MKLLKYLLLIISSQIFSQPFPDTTNGVLWEYSEWTINNVQYSGNPFDITATVSFIHTGTNEIKTTEMFYDGNNTWKFRFTGTRKGIWNFFSTSKIKKLNGLKGVVNIKDNPDKNATGFLSYVGNKFVIQTSPDSVRGFVFNVYMNGTNDKYSFRNGTTKDFTEYAQEAKRNGCTAIFSSIVANSWFNFPTLKTTEGKKKNPDPQTFAKLEEMIAAARKESMVVHIWAWGDAENKLTQKYIGEGINGKEDKRLQRYIAARLGPVPGWSMGYGFDLHEWTNPEQVNEWAEYLQNKMAWNHLLSARGIKIGLPNTIDSYDGFAREGVMLYTTIFGPRDFKEIFEDLQQDTTKPHLYEERHTYLRKDAPNGGIKAKWNLDMDGTRRLIWRETVAGGIGGWFGFYNESSKAYGGYPYPNPEQLETHRIFWMKKKRFLIDMIADSNSSGTYILTSSTTNNVVLYKENTNTIEYAFNTVPPNTPVIAVDTKLAYKEIQIDNSTLSKTKWNAPYKSDWAIAIGKFEKGNFKNDKKNDEHGNVELTSFIFSHTENTVILEWETANERNVKGYLIESSKENDSTTWNAIGFLTAGNNATGKYEFTHFITLGKQKINYRLKIFFTNKTTITSNIISAKKIIPNKIIFSGIELFKLKNGIKIQWKTSLENNVNKFIVERYTDLNNVWTKIGEVNGSSGNSKVYEYIDTLESVAIKNSYRIKTIFNDGSFQSSDVLEYSASKLKFDLYQNYPNPFNPTTTIKYTIPTLPASVMLNSFQHLDKETSKQVRGDKLSVSLKVYNILGKEIATLVNKKQKPGIYEVTFNGSKYSSGVYFYRLIVDKTIVTKKMILLR